MKTKTILVSVLAGAMALSSCTRKMDEKTVSEMNQFSTEWSAMGEKATEWSKQLTETTTHAKEFAAKQTAMMNNMSGSKDEAMKTKMGDMMKTTNDNCANLDAMVNDWNNFKTSWDENTKAYTEWQAKAMKGEMTPEEVNKGMADWRTKMTEAQQKMDNWNTAYMATKESCEKTMAAGDEMSKSMMTTPAQTNSPKGKMKK